jgi:hypothetical protein
MKITAALIIYLLFAFFANAQNDYSGNYGFQMKVYVHKDSEKKPSKEERGQGRMGDLTLLRIEKNRYKFWLSVNRGWPSFNMGELDGFIEVENNEAVYTAKMEFSDSSCAVIFVFSAKSIKVEQSSGSNECGFGHNVYAGGTYKLKTRKAPKNIPLINSYYSVSKYRVISEKAFLYEDAEGTIQKKQYFIKGDNIILLNSNAEFIYTEYFTPGGKFVYGWLKKEALKEVKQ